MARQTNPYEQRLDKTLVLRSVRTADEAERFAAFNNRINGADQGMTCTQLLRHHPETSFDDFLFVEDETTGEVVSTTCLIPWRCRWGGVELNVAMLEMVVTDPAYRHRRLVRAQIDRFHQAVQEQGFDLSIIEGIPNYYRQFGYTYATDHWPYDALPAWRIPAAGPDGADEVELRQASLADLPTLQQFYDTAQEGLDLYAERSAAYWHFLLSAAHYPLQMVVDKTTGATAGYICSWPFGQKSGIFVAENGLPVATAWALLRLFQRAGHSEIELGGPEHNTLLRIGRSLGSRPGECDQWLLRTPDMAALLVKLGPLFEQRLAASPSAGLTMDLCINLFRQAFHLKFERGKLTAVTNAGFVDASMGADGGDLCIPSDAFLRLLVGYRTLEQLRDAWPDIIVKPSSSRLLETLLPKQTAYFWLPYLYRGEL